MATLQTGVPNYSGGYVSYPGGDFTPDPQGAINFDQGARLYRTVATPQLSGSGAPPTYTHLNSRWLPAPFAVISPDNAHYAYEYFPGAQPQNSKSEIHVVDVATGADRVAYRGGSYFAFDWESEGIYLHSGHYGGEGYSGLWLLDPATGQLKTIVPTGFWYRIGGGGAWSGDIPAGDSPGVGLNPMTEVLRRDLKTGQMTSWFHRPGANLSVAGFDLAGHPFVLENMPSGSSTTDTLWLVTSPNQGTKVWSGANGGLVLESDPVSDGHGSWFGLLSGIWLYHDGRFDKVSSTSAAISGRCL